MADAGLIATLAASGLALAGTCIQSWRMYKASTAKEQSRRQAAAIAAAPELAEVSITGWKTLTQRLDQEIGGMKREVRALQTQVYELRVSRDDCERRVARHLNRVLNLESAIKAMGGTVP